MYVCVCVALLPYDGRHIEVIIWPHLIGNVSHSMGIHSSMRPCFEWIPRLGMRKLCSLHVHGYGEMDTDVEKTSERKNGKFHWKLYLIHLCGSAFFGWTSWSMNGIRSCMRGPFENLRFFYEYRIRHILISITPIIEIGVGNTIETEKWWERERECFALLLTFSL